MLRRRGGRAFSGGVAVPESGVWRRMKSTIRRIGAAWYCKPSVRAAWAPATIAIALVACASMPGGLSKDSAPEAKQAVVTERINARWQALIKGDLDTAYTYMSTASREAMPLKVYKLKIKPGMWRSVNLDSVECAAEICKAKMTLTYDHKRMKNIQTPFEETWIIDKGTAWYVYRDQD